ncbi:M28 family peptidase [Pendulispora brunnea]|uniref:M28 family peptidase n=1 Tax=Pendulispora brunnea TaxID=2905690 RepID=A0ABZ2JXH7_9BACT
MPRHMFANARANARVGDELGAAFERCGLRARYQGRYRNVIALPPVEGPVTFVAAHYDSVAGSPGADDNASGLAVMLECARLLAQGGFPVGFIAFNGEEDGLLGSRDFVNRGSSELPCPIRLVHVLEMVGFRATTSDPPARLPLPWVPSGLKIPDFLGLIAKGPSNAVVDRVIASPDAPGLRLVGAKTWGPLHKLIPDLTRSDHFPFWNAGIPAVLWTDTGNFRNPNYHRATDTPDTLDYRFMQGVTDVLVAVLATRSPA